MMAAPFFGQADSDFQSYFADTMTGHGIIAAGYALIDHNEIIGAQITSKDDAISVTPNSLFQACSFSKVLTAFATLKLIEARKFNLDDTLPNTLTTWLPTGSDIDKVTIRRCLNMTSGLAYANPAARYLQTDDIPTLEQTLHGIAPAKTGIISVATTPGSRYSYSGAGYMALQKLIEEKTGRSFVEFMAETMGALGMPHSTFAYPLPSAQATMIIPGFSADGTMNDRGWEVIATSASGGMWSTPPDIAAFMLALTRAYQGTDQALISSASAKAMLTPQDNPAFGLGIAIDGMGETFNFRKNGRNNGYHHQFIMFPEKGQGLVIMTNSAGGAPFIQEVMAYAAAKYSWPPYNPDFDESKVITLLAADPSPSHA